MQVTFSQKNFVLAISHPNCIEIFQCRPDILAQKLSEFNCQTVCLLRCLLFTTIQGFPLYTNQVLLIISCILSIANFLNTVFKFSKNSQPYFESVETDAKYTTQDSIPNFYWTLWKHRFISTDQICQFKFFDKALFSSLLL